MNRLVSAGWGFVRYCLSGGASLLVYIGVGNALYYSGLPPALCTLLAWTGAALVAYFGHIHFSFRVQADHRAMSLRFAVLLGINFLLIAGFTYVLFGLLGVGYSVTSVLVSAATPLVTYPIGKYWVFREPAKTTN